MDEQEVRYSFTGDLGDLKDAVTKAMGFLDQYAAKFKQTDAASTMKKSQKSFQELRKSLNGLGSSFRNTNKQTKNLTSSMRSLSGAGSLVKKALLGLTGVKLGNWLADAAKESISYIENLNLFKVAMGQSAEQGLKFVDTMSELYGMDPSNLYRYSGYFYELTDAIGMADEASATLSLSMTKAANDIASLFNVNIETVVNNLASGMQGMSRSVRKYGMDIRAVTLQQTALSYGLTEQVENMSEADRMALRYLTMMNQVRNATSQVVDETVQASGIMGDFARNIETPANQLRVFKEQVSQLGRAIGNFLIPALSKLLPIINGVIMAIRTVLTFLSALTGFKLDFAPVSSGAADTAKAFGGIADAAGGASKAAKELKKTLAPFDELNLLQAPNEDSGGGGGGGGSSGDLLNPALAEAIQNMSLSLEDIEMKANKVRDSLLKFFGFDYVEVFNPDTGEYEKKLQWFADRFETNLINKFPQWSKTIQALFDNWTNLVEGFKNVFASLGAVVDALKQRVKSFFDSLKLDDVFSTAITSMVENLNRFADWISEHAEQIADFILLIGKVWLAFRAAQTVTKYVKPLVTLVTLVTLVSQLVPVLSSLSGLASAVAPLLAIAATFALLYNSSNVFATSINNLVRSLLDVLGQLWETVQTIGQSVLEMLRSIWENTISPVLTAIGDAIGMLLMLINMLWTEVLGPLFSNILSSLPELFNNVIRPIIEKVVNIIGSVIEIILALWTNAVAPLLAWLISVLAPSVRNVLNTVWDIVSAVVGSIGSIINGLIQILQGIVNFVAGIFTGDWQRAWKGIAEIFAGIANAITGVFESCVNLIISLVNGLISLVWSGLQGLVNFILSLVNGIGRMVGLSVNLSWGSPPPAIGYVNIPEIGLATGGVITGPTNALIGEGRYDEAVIPLGNSPQMNDFANKIAGKINTSEQVALLREQNQLLQRILDASGNAVGIKDLTGTITKIQRQNTRAGGY